MSAHLPEPLDILEWALNTWGNDVAGNTNERARRFLEEAMELAQSCGVTWEETYDLSQRVYGNDADKDTHKEAGQAVLTLYALCAWMAIDPDDALLREWRRVQEIPQEEWQRRQGVKRDQGLGR